MSEVIWTHRIVSVAESSDSYRERHLFEGQRCRQVADDPLENGPGRSIPEGYKRLQMIVEAHPDSYEAKYLRRTEFSRPFHGVIVQPLEPPDDPTWDDNE